MTFPAKENLIFFETLNKTQTQLFDDACDLGIELNNATFGDIALKDAARSNLLALMENYSYDLNKYATGSVTNIFIPFEFDEGAYVGVNLTVDFCKGRASREYLLVDICRARKTHAEAEANGPLFKMPSTPEQDTYEEEKAAWEAEAGRSTYQNWNVGI